jgi:hypothetical protein
VARMHHVLDGASQTQSGVFLPDSCTRSGNFQDFLGKNSLSRGTTGPGARVFYDNGFATAAGLRPASAASLLTGGRELNSARIRAFWLRQNRGQGKGGRKRN